MPHLKLITPVDAVITTELAAGAPARTVPIDRIPADMMGADVGPETVTRFKEAIAAAGTIIWNGPLGSLNCRRSTGGRTRSPEHSPLQGP